MTTTTADNPLLQPWTAPYGLPPFGAIEPGHFEPALRVAMQAHLAELDAIAAQREPPSFANTLAPYDRSGRLLDRIASTFYNLASSATSLELQEVQRALAAPMAAHANAVHLNQALFARIDAVHAQRDAAALAPEQRRLVERVHLDFVRAGARLAGDARRRFAELNERLAELQTSFAQNVLHDEASYRLELADEAALAGLPDFVRAAARQAALDRGHDGHAITLARSLVLPFLGHSQRRDLREQVWRAWVGRGEHPGAHDNRPLVGEILRLRAEQARLLGYPCHADYALADTMAGSQSAVARLLDEVWTRSLAAMESEQQALEAVVRREGGALPVEPWDWRYWAEKVRAERYAVDDAEVKPYLPLERVVEAAFDCAQRLFGLGFAPRADLPVYHPDVRAYEVSDAAGRVIGVFLQDNHARPGKRSGAWMSSLRLQHRNVPGGGSGGRGFELPIIVNNNNFAKGEPGTPTLLSIDDAHTLFHEFGHGLHGLLSDVTYERLSGTQVLRDFVELPSQLFEHWIDEPEVLARHARHWKSGEAMPKSLIDRLAAAARFDQGYETVRYAASALVDMAVHAQGAEALAADPVAFEAALLESRGLPRAAGTNHRLVHFQHLFSSPAYAAGYYVYLWAEVLDADAYDAFREAGNPFDPRLAEALRRHVYAAGNTVEPGAAYLAFRGRPPAVAPLLRQRGLIAEPQG